MLAAARTFRREHVARRDQVPLLGILAAVAFTTAFWVTAIVMIASSLGAEPSPVGITAIAIVIGVFTAAVVTTVVGSNTPASD